MRMEFQKFVNLLDITSEKPEEIYVPPEKKTTNY